MNYSEKECALLSLFPIQQNCTATPVLFNDLHFDTEKYGYLLALSQLGYQTNWLGFPSDIIPRLKGMRRQTQVRYSLSLHESAALFKTLHLSDIKYFVFDNFAFVLLGLDKVPLSTSKIYIQIKPQDKEKLLSIAVNLGFSCQSNHEHLSIKKNSTFIIVFFDESENFNNIQSVQILNIPIFVATTDKLFQLQKLQSIKNYAITCNLDIIFYCECLFRANNLNDDHFGNIPNLSIPNNKSIIDRLLQNHKGFELLKEQHLLKNNVSFISYLIQKRGNRL